MGSGAVFFDYDADGWVDLFLVDGGSLADAAVAARARHRLFRNQRRRHVRRRHRGVARSATAEYGMGACAGDVDNDGRIDLYVTNYGANALYRNDGDGVFADVTRDGGRGTAAAGAPAARSSTWTATATWICSSPTTSTRPKTNNRFCGDPQRRIRVLLPSR